MRFKLFFIIGIVVGLMPIYSTLGWLYVFNVYPHYSHAEKVIHFKHLILHDISVNLGFLSLLLILCGAISIICFSISLRHSGAIENKYRAKFNFSINLLLLIIVSIFTALNLWMSL